ncbi:cytochrome c oxidase subunit cyclope [Lasioglossum baleicum]|uniref:cytochrome c oxidase subunit cyclope n=1 Tax=Lasioglossum baleicum TaxID=434251 RepID=UPI003FCC56C5
MSEGRLKKPELRNLHIAYTRKHLIGMILFSFGWGAFYKLVYTDPASRRIEAFYKTYDAEASLKIMDEAGLMQSSSN